MDLYTSLLQRKMHMLRNLRERFSGLGSKIWKEVLYFFRGLYERIFSLDHASSERAYYFNKFMQGMSWPFAYIILSIAVLLQQFAVTEPLAFGLFWITIASLVLGVLGNPYEMHDERSITFSICITVAGILLQVYIVVFHWSRLLAFDKGLHEFRIRAFGDHRYFGWSLWGFCTAIAAVVILYLALSFLRKNGPSKPLCM